MQKSKLIDIDVKEQVIEILIDLFRSIMLAIPLYLLAFLTGPWEWSNKALFYSMLGVMLWSLIVYLRYNKIFIYLVEVERGLITIKWKEFSKWKEQTLPITNVMAEMVVAGKRSYSLRLTLNVQDGSFIVLNHGFFSSWKEKDMRRFVDEINRLKGI